MRLVHIVSLVSVWGALPAAAQPTQQKASMQRTTTGGPQLAYERFRREVQFEVAEKREAQITGLKRLLSIGASLEEEPELRFRLAELYADKARFFFFRSQEQGERILRAKSAEEKEAYKNEGQIALEESRVWANEAIKVYEIIQNRFSDYPRMPEVLFALGQSLWTAGRHKDALRPYADLIRKYPNNPLVAEAWLAFGEYYFDQNEVPRALKSYEKASEHQRSRVYGFALYKQAWCYFNLAEWHKALRKFEATVLFSQMSEEMSGENKIALGREAQSDWVRTFVHIGSADIAQEELVELLDMESCSGRCLKLLDALGGLWMEEGYFSQSADIYRQLIALQPNSLRNPLRQGRIVDLVDRMGNKRQTLGSAKRLVDIFKLARARFEQLSPSAPERLEAESDIEEAQIISETTLRRLAQEWNKEARKTKQSSTFGLAQAMYSHYLDIFFDSKYAYQMRFQYADLLYKLERFDEAAKAYRTVVEASPVEGEHLREAANDNILAVEEHLRDLTLNLPSNLKQPTSLHPQHQRLVDAVQRYLTYVSSKDGGETYPAVKLKLARVWYAYNQFEPAIETFESLVSNHPRSEQAIVAANLVVDIYNLQKDWDALYEAARRYLDNKRLMRGRSDLRKALVRFGEYAKFAVIQKLEEGVREKSGSQLTASKRADLQRVADGYEEFYREFPRSENADEALFNASVLRDRLGEKAKAASLRSRLLRQYRDSPLRADVAFYVAKRHQERTEYRRAARSLEAFASEFPKDARARDALYDASVFYAGTGQIDKAARLRTLYLKEYGRRKNSRKEIKEIAYAMAADLERARRWRKAATEYAVFAKRFPVDARAFDARWHEAEILRTKLRRPKDAETKEKKLLGTVNWLRKKGRKVPPNALRYASLVAFKMVEDDFRDYAKLRLEVPNVRNPRPFQRSLRKKGRVRDRLIRRYTSVVTKYRQAEASIASLYKIAQAWDVFVKSIVSLPCPRGISRSICTELRGQLQQMSAPARQSAVVAYQACVTESNKLETFTPYSTKCARRLETLAPQVAPPMVEQIVEHQPDSTLGMLEPNMLILETPRVKASTRRSDARLPDDPKPVAAAGIVR